MRGLSRGLLERPGMSSKVAHWARAIPAAASVAVRVRRKNKRKGFGGGIGALRGGERGGGGGGGASAGPSPSAAAAGALHLLSAATARVARHLTESAGGEESPTGL